MSSPLLWREKSSFNPQKTRVRTCVESRRGQLGRWGQLGSRSPPGDSPECIWDLDGDDAVGPSDLITLLGTWGTDPGGPPDFDGDGNVGTSDLIELLRNWGPCPK